MQDYKGICEGDRAEYISAANKDRAKSNGASALDQGRRQISEGAGCMTSMLKSEAS